MVAPGSAFIWAQQEYTMTDQLNMGIRELHLDPHWYILTQNTFNILFNIRKRFFGAMRLCHAGDQITWIDDVIKKVCVNMQYNNIC